MTLPKITQHFPEMDPEATLGLWQLYLDESVRGMGLGRELYEEAEATASGIGARSLYLHCDGISPSSQLNYWKNVGFLPYTEPNSDGTVHMTKELA